MTELILSKNKDLHLRIVAGMPNALHLYLQPPMEQYKQNVQCLKLDLVFILDQKAVLLFVLSFSFLYCDYSSNVKNNNYELPD